MQHDPFLDALGKAIKQKDVVAVRTWLADGGNVHASDYAYRSPLAMAASSGHTEIIRTVLDAGADINERWPAWSTPLCLAAMSGSAKAVALLLHRGAKTTAQGQPLTELLRTFGYGSRTRILRLIDEAHRRVDAGAV